MIESRQSGLLHDVSRSVFWNTALLPVVTATGVLLSILVLYFFLRHWPSTLMVTTAIPICFVMTLGFMYFAGVTLNILTMNDS